MGNDHLSTYYISFARNFITISQPVTSANKVYFPCCKQLITTTTTRPYFCLPLIKTNDFTPPPPIAITAKNHLAKKSPWSVARDKTSTITTGTTRDHSNFNRFVGLSLLIFVVVDDHHHHQQQQQQQDLLPCNSDIKMRSSDFSCGFMSFHSRR